MVRHILQLVDSFHQGGSEGQAVQLTRLLHESGRYRVHLACLSRKGVLLGAAESLGLGEIPEYPLTSFYDRNAFAQVFRFARFLRERRIDVVQTHDFYTNIFGMAGAALAGVPVRVASRRESGKKPRQKRALERGAYRLAHAVIANCKEVRQQLIREGVRAEKVIISYNGLDRERVTAPASLPRHEALAALGLPNGDVAGGDDRRFVTIVANLRDVKDHRTFLRAAQRVRAAVPEAAFLIAGEGELMDSLKSLAAELGLREQTFFLGRCERVAALLSVSEVCVLCSRSEGFSNSILEYMAAARPVVATEVGGAREAITEGLNGYLVRSGDDENLAARISSLLRDPDKARLMGENGSRLVDEKFSCEVQLKRVSSLYDRLLMTKADQPSQADEAAQGEGVSESASRRARN
ncbi:MAG: glycosyltransferase [Pyrinomonadaceae bacterium]